MGEAHERAKLDLAPRILRPGQQVQVDLKNAMQRECECGCKFFIMVNTVFTVSALVSPIGQELIVQQPVLVCKDCGELLKNKEAMKPVEEEGEKGVTNG